MHPLDVFFYAKCYKPNQTFCRAKSITPPNVSKTVLDANNGMNVSTALVTSPQQQMNSANLRRHVCPVLRRHWLPTAKLKGLRDGNHVRCNLCFANNSERASNHWRPQHILWQAVSRTIIPAKLDHCVKRTAGHLEGGDVIVDNEGEEGWLVLCVSCTACCCSPCSLCMVK